MRLPFILLIGVVLALLMFTKNPIREFQESRRALLTKYGTDELTIKTNVFIEQQQQQKNPMSFGDQSAGNPSENIYKGMLQSQTEEKNDDININLNTRTGMLGTNPPKARPPVISQTIAQPSEDLYEGDINIGVNSPPSYPSLQPGLDMQNGLNQQSLNSNNSYNPNIVNSPAPPQRVNNYYPPVMPDITVSSTNSTQKVALSGNEAKLRSGHPIIFDGTDVYTVDASGNRKILPDGNYTLQDGSIIKISEGKMRGQD